jgi:hypothetical protein
MVYRAYVISCLLFYQIYNCLLMHSTKNLVNYSRILPLFVLLADGRRQDARLRLAAICTCSVPL